MRVESRGLGASRRLRVRQATTTQGKVQRVWLLAAQKMVRFRMRA